MFLSPNFQKMKEEYKKGSGEKLISFLKLANQLSKATRLRLSQLWHIGMMLAYKDTCQVSPCWSFMTEFKAVMVMHKDTQVHPCWRLCVLYGEKRTSEA